jgi:hypothetical protein
VEVCIVTVSPSEIDQVPPLFAESLRHNLQPDESIHRLIFSPEFMTVKTQHLASIFCVTDRQWLIAIKEQKGNITVQRATFRETLVIELTVILLHGKLKIDFAEGGKIRSAALHFNTVAKPRYYAAICEMLGAAHERAGSPPTQVSVRFPDWPLKLRNMAIIYIPPGCQLLDGAYSPTIYGRLFGEKAAAAVLLLTEQYLILIAEEKSRRWFPPKDDQKFGSVMSYIPRQRVLRWEFENVRGVDLHSLQLSTGQGIGSFKFFFSPDRQDQVLRLIDQVVSDPSAPSQSETNHAAR